MSGQKVTHPNFCFLNDSTSGCLVWKRDGVNAADWILVDTQHRCTIIVEPQTPARPNDGSFQKNIVMQRRLRGNDYVQRTLCFVYQNMECVHGGMSDGG